MLNIYTEHIGNLAIIECDGRIASAKAASRLGEAVTAEVDAEAVVVDLTGVDVVNRSALKMFAFLQRWGQTHDVQLKMFGPTHAVRDRLRRAKLDVAGLHEMIVILARAEEQEQKFTCDRAA
jgi:anti-anti-sigma regulatory factor